MKRHDRGREALAMGGRGRQGIRAAVIVALVAVATTACSQLTFVRQDFSRGDYEKTAYEVSVSDASLGKGASGVRGHLQRAQERLVAGDYPAAEREARQALKLDPNSADAYTLLGAAAERRGAVGEAGQHYLRATELAPGNGGVLNNYGVWLCGQGQAAQALPWFDRAVADSNYATPAMALANSGNCAIRAGQDARAERDLRRAIALDPANAAALGALAELEFAPGQCPGRKGVLGAPPGRCTSRSRRVAACVTNRT